MQTLMRHEPDEVYNLAGQSSVGLSFEQPGRTYDSIMTGTLNLLEAIRLLKSRSDSTMLVPVSALGKVRMVGPQSWMRSGREAPMRWLRRQLFGRWPIPRSLWSLCVLRSSFQPRVTLKARAICDP